ncbi:MAG: CRISPR system precrRNA processing endoribonuclease RAMP protein Cas6 [Thermosynechococcaceae cyanobacterium]
MLTSLPQPPKTTALYSLLIRLSAADKGRIPVTLGRAIHAQVMQWLNAGNCELAIAVHNAQVSPLSLSDLMPAQPQTCHSRQFSIRVSLLDGCLLEPLLLGLEQHGTTPISLGKFPFVICGIETLPGLHPSVQVSDYQWLYQVSETQHNIKLKFCSPTSFKQQQHIQPFPLPELVFGSLLRRWNTFAPESLQFPVVEWQGLIAAYDLKTRALKMKGGAEIGAQGWVNYRFPDPEQARIATVLAHFATFAGVGRKTAMGMGQTQLH